MDWVGGRNCWILKQFLLKNLHMDLLRLNPCWVLYQKLWGRIVLALEPWAGRPGVGLGSLAPKIPPFMHYTWV